ncbi:MarR family winged helix-turn-helix transcriptional regulator [Curtobacterium luteum]|uniref:MarR family winged helix-turn-helix transcriptional regulator n=1 Tax=Curtobacterium luteum TaxID=33881 RepID=UPI00381E187D
MEHDEAPGGAVRPSPTEPRTRAGADALAGLQALGDSAHESDEHALQALHLRPTEALALQHVVRADADGRRLNPTQLSELLRLTTAGVTKLLDRLARAGLVERTPNRLDRRGVVVTPTETGRAALAAAYRHVQTPVIAAIDELSDTEAEIIGRIASRLAAALREERRVAGAD